MRMSRCCWLLAAAPGLLVACDDAKVGGDASITLPTKGGGMRGPTVPPSGNVASSGTTTAATTAAPSARVPADAAPPHAMEPTILITHPATLRCPADPNKPTEIEWSDLKDWDHRRDRSKCSREDAYRVSGRVAGASPGMYVKAEIKVPEAGDKWWPSSGGGYLPIEADGSFLGYFCIAHRAPERTFRFVVVDEQYDRHGKACVIHVRAL